jgi:hypothetical protein
MITRAQIRRQLRSQGGIMNAVPRQGYVFGGVSKAIKKVVSKAGDVVGQVTKSPIGKAALLGAGLYYGGGGNLFGAQRAGMTGFSLGNLPGYLKAKNFMMGQPLGFKTAGDTVARSSGFLSKLIPSTTLGKAALGAGAITLLGLSQEDQPDPEEIMGARRRGNLEEYLRRYYKNVNQNATDEEVEEFVRINKAKGGRIGYAQGTPENEMDETLTIYEFMKDQGIDAGAKTIKKEGTQTAFYDAGDDKTNALNVWQSMGPEDRSLFDGFLDFFQDGEWRDRIKGALPMEQKMASMEAGQESTLENIYFDLIDEGLSPADAEKKAKEMYNNMSQAPSERGIMAAKGGRIKYAMGSDGMRSKALAALYNDDDEENKASGGRVGLKKGSPHGKTDKEVLEEKYPTLFSDTTTSIEGSPKKKKNYKKKAQGGRIGRYGGGMGLMGLPGMPRMAADGIEYDMRAKGGFQPLGSKEGKDDVKAMLAKNEFVMTADAVRGAGEGDVNKGAQRMYDTMKKLEGKVA